MLQFLTRGSRNFYEKPLSPSQRLNWEFYAVIDGQCAPWFSGKRSRNPITYGPAMWVFPPYHSHGWVSRQNTIAEVVCLHFLTVPQRLQDAVYSSSGEYLMVDLSARDSRCIRELHEEIVLDYENPTNLSFLIYEKALLELSILILKQQKMVRLSTLHSDREEKIRRAIEFYKGKLHLGASVNDVAKFVNVSPTYLRQLFKEEIEMSPKQCFEQIRLRKAAELLGNTKQTLDTIAIACGYNAGNELSRAFKRHYEIAPNIWRRSRLPDPDSSSGDDDLNFIMGTNRNQQIKIDKYFLNVGRREVE